MRAESITKSFEDKKILITGGCGSVGRKILEYILSFNPSVVRIFDINENFLFYFKRESKNENIRFLLGDIRDKERLIMAMNDIDYVFHTAALKHVEICEYNPFEAVKTNVIGTQNVIDAAIECNVEKVIFTSSDKAVNPSNTMGASKLLAEKLTVAANFYRGPKARTKFACVRFGNILGSSGSVLPLFKDQIKNGGPITVTHRDMNRFILTQKKALEFLLKSMIFAKGGEIFVPKMPVMRVMDLVDVLLREYAPKVGKNPEDIKIEHIGIKSGEKLYEELMTEDEASRCILVDGWIYVILPQFKELSDLEPSMYPNAKPFDGAKLKSSEYTPISKNELREILIKNNLI
jgi:FlaA1/EpsC-like NDP-sugar epimerase